MTTGTTTLVGQSLNGLEVCAELGRGGMGEVYRARDPQLERFVAVKIVGAKAAEDAEFSARFLREARSASSIHHPNVAQIYAAGEHEGRPYYVMELVEGQSLAELLEKHGPLAGRRCLSYLVQAAQGLRAAQRAGIVHRDIKPGNLMLDEQGRLKIVDFGLARRLEGEATLTRSDVVVGTPAYLAPEQALGGEVDHRADIYALGATFYHLFSGQLPFEADTPLGLLMKHAREPLPPLKERNPRVPQSVCAVIERMLAKDPGDRYATYDELIADLRAVAQGSGPVRALQSQAAAPGFPAGAQSARRSAVQQPGLWVVAGLLFVLGIGLWSTSSARRPDGESPATPATSVEPPVVQADAGARTVASGHSTPPPSPSGAVIPRDVPSPPSALLERTQPETAVDRGAEALIPSTSPPFRPPPLAPRTRRYERDRTMQAQPRRRPLPQPTDYERLAEAVGAGVVLQRAQGAQTLAQMRRLFTLSQIYFTEHGTPPASLEDLGAVEPLPPRSVVDSWGSPIRLESHGESVLLSSAGADGTFGSADDLVLEDGSVVRGGPLGR